MADSERVELASEVSGKNVVLLTSDPRHIELYLTVRFPSKVAPVRAEQIRAALDKLALSISFEEQQKLERFLAEYEQSPAPIEQRLLVSGRPPRDGQDAPIHWPAQDGADQPAEGGESADTVDHYSLSSIATIKPGEVVCRLGEPVPGEDGIDIHGKPLPAAEARALPVKAGENVGFSDDMRSLFATTEGLVVVQQETVSVQALIEVAGNVDFGVGSIDFNGVVRVKGNILDGFSVRATRDLWVGGNIEGATVEAGGQIKVDGGITGHGKGRVTAEGTIEAKYINGATVQSCRDILVETEIVNSSITAYGTIQIRKGGIIGGQATAGHAIHSTTLGSQMYVPTEIRLTEKLRGRRTQRFTKELIDIRQAELKIVPVITKFTQNPELLKSLPPDRQQAISQLAQQLKRLRERKEELMDSAESTRPQSTTPRQIYVKKMVFPKVVLEVDTFLLRVADETRGPVKFRGDKKAQRVELSRGWEAEKATDC